MDKRLARRIYLQMHLTGASLTKVLKKFEVGRSTFYDWRQAHTDLAEQIDGETRIQAEQLASQHFEQALRAKAHTQHLLEAKALPKMGELMDAMLQKALTEGDGWFMLAVWREASTLLQKGISSAAEPRLLPAGSAVAVLPSEVPDPFGAIHRVEVEGTDGSTLTFERGDQVEGEWTEPDDTRMESDDSS